MKKRIYFENLDGLRFLCFLSVFFFHSFHTEHADILNSKTYHFLKKDVFGNGNIGVNFFFVLSGFLITYLLIEEKRLNGQVNLGRFWLRRILRIWPLFYFCVFFGFVIFPWVKQAFGQVPNETATPIYYLTFLNNFDFIQKGLPDSSVLGVLWSIAVEEQFYLIWPIILFLFPERKLWIPFVIILAGNLIFRAFNNKYIMHEYHSLSCIGDMTIGALGAWLMTVSDKFKKRIEGLSRMQIAGVYLVFIVIFFFRDELLMGNATVRIFERLFIASCILLIILEQTFAENSFFKMAKFKAISKLGIITYGLYCLHFIGILITTTLTKKLGVNTQLWQVFFIDTPVALLISVIICKLSYKYYETPFLKLKERFAYIIK
ncbi:MAG TPA: acyltransferase [Bacteroidia bacterium]|jgi:peptidoglycan/LPS O-acetylase OafA/YrhL|nr:acyltransferase [Bacteroidia bacterium]